ncbi:aryl-alcohol dehydrogenase-like predicted oxidoreductase [Aminobacter aganoensis]|uniref:Aryl-alcohol dehydrogenase-like predicted oxidoreductase n=3 Tax=Aminobacter aganoensis TaxID=83264 RepID=A0A7X0FD43_9HYPH|nr:aryl-alcohol dehydrogenase-like predicted oxidoreductase [Aminobacter aganoensis]
MNFADATPEEDAREIVRVAHEAGVNFFDTAGNYNGGESERALGRAIADLGQRHEFIVATKCHFPIGPGPNDRGNSRLHVIRACEDALRRLGTDYIDLYQLHRPVFDIPFDETLGAMDDLVRQGKVRYIGTSTHPAWKVMEGLMISDKKNLARFVSEQPPYNLLDRRVENELAPLCDAHGIGIIPYAPMAQGVLAGRYSSATNVPADSRAARKGGLYQGRVNDRGVEVGQKLAALAGGAGITPAQLALLWVKDQRAVTAPIFGPRTVGQLREALPMTEMSLTSDIRDACDDLVPPGSAVTNFHNGAAWLKQVLV